MRKLYRKLASPLLQRFLSLSLRERVRKKGWGKVGDREHSTLSFSTTKRYLGSVLPKERKLEFFL